MRIQHLVRTGAALGLFALFSTNVLVDSLQPASAATSIIGYGVNGGEGRLDVVQAMGFNWIKLTVPWKQYEPSRGSYQFADLDGRVDRAKAKGFKVLVRVDDTPDWASSRPGAFNAPPTNDADLGNFMAAIAARYRGRVQGYEIYNEPNLNYEWGNFDPDPVRYGEMLKALYPRVKQADASAVVVTGGLSTAGGATSGPYLGDLYYLSKLVDPNQDGNPNDGYSPYFDAVGSHPYGGPYSADTPPSVAQFDVGTYFRRAEQQHDIVFNEGKVDKPVWATEFGWIIDPAQLGQNCDLGGHFNRLKVTPDFQAQQFVAAYQYAATNWYWMGPMFLFNLDMSTDSFRSPCDQVRFFSILKSDASPLPAYTALKGMAKVGVPLPNQPSLVGPSHNATLTTLGPTLSWSNPDGTTQVQLQVTPSNNDGAAVNLIFDATNSFALPAPPAWYGMLPGMGYSWRVRTTTKPTSADQNDPSWGPWSDIYLFRTPVPDTSKITLSVPAAGVSVNTLNPVLTWTTADPVLFYFEVQVSKDSSFNTNPATAIAMVYQELIHGGISNPANSYSIPSSFPLEGKQVYYWRVRPRVQGDGTPVSWTPARSLKTP